MRSAPIVRPEFVARPALVRVLSATEARRAFHYRVLDRIREFLDDHAMQGKTGAREFYEFEKTLHERLLEAESCCRNVGHLPRSAADAAQAPRSSAHS